MKIIGKIIFIVFIFLFIANVVLYVKSLRLSSDIKGLEDDISNLQIEVEKLQEKALVKESINNIASQAAQLGFGNISKIIRIDTSKVAFK